MKPQADALVIGCGGGIDILIGLHHGARPVVGVDINPHTITFIKETYKDFAGGVYQRDDVELIVSEGRHFLSRDRRTFDVIQLSGVDTWSALTTGAYALTENFLYTAEAFDQYLSHLKEDGILNFSRPFLVPPNETLKLASTALEALERLNIRDSFKHLMIIAEAGRPGQIASRPFLPESGDLLPEPFDLLVNHHQDNDPARPPSRAATGSG